MATDAADSRLWRFSVALYRLPGVEQALLEWQDRHGADVNVLLYLLFIAIEGRRLDAADIGRIEALTAPWRREVVVPLRGVRRALKSPIGAFEPDASAPLREEVKRIELAAERLQQLTLERLLPPQRLGSASDQDAAPSARTHLVLYRTQLGAAREAPIDPLIAALDALPRS